jgi:hypothetical protein
MRQTCGQTESKQAARRCGKSGFLTENLAACLIARSFPEECPSGQWEQTVNLPAQAFGGSNPPSSTKDKEVQFKQFLKPPVFSTKCCVVRLCGISSMVEL